MSKLLTIVVPVYKVEQYINKCLDSCIIYTTDENGNRVLDEELMNQLEVIIVNDGTPDNSAELSREYTIRYPQTFRQIDKENGGHGSAWNVGVKEATGKYLRFLDSDDWLTNLDLLMKKLQDCEADLVFTHKFTYFAEKGNGYVSRFDDEYDIVKPISRMPIDGFQKEAWYGEFQKATYKVSKIKKQYPLFIEKVRYDDAILYCAPLIFSDNYIVYDMVVYNYFIGRIGQSMDFAVQSLFADQRLLAYKYLCDYIDSHTTSIQVSKICEWIKLGMYNDILPVLICGKFKNSKMYYQQISVYQPKVGIISKVASRFKKFPFFIAYFLEKIRRSKLYTAIR